ncbi:M23 family metallopeptidase [Amniculibacterium sp. G2-70]|uniref:M23 family metallopeptidase n=1 Tax=Amniculibacterium sp. G2-70 TaxID=2767188 RepID=UPI001653EF39|nr:M23 family metallopeptidase [Amniculibacterium sp. G2-70]
MKRILVKVRKPKNATLLFGIFLSVIIGQALLIGKLFAERDNKNYEVNLVKINTKKDSIDYSKMKTDLHLINNTVRSLRSFLASKNIVDAKVEQLAQDSLDNSVYLAKQSNRYSQFLVDLQNKLMQVPLGAPTDGRVSSNFGKRVNPIPFKTVLATVGTPVTNSNTSKSDSAMTKKGSEKPAVQMQFHKGMDFAVPFGSDVKCTAAGKVVFSGTKGGYGKCVIVSHGNGLATLYGHLSELLVQTNDEVEVGTVVAKSGNSGRSTGPHLHYEVHKNGTPINPKLFLNL